MRRIHIALLVLFAGLCLLPAACAQSDAVQLGRNIVIGEDQSVTDAVCFFCSITVNGTLHGDAVAFFGNVDIDGETHGDVVTFFGNDTLGPDTKIGGDMVTFFGSTALGENSRVGGDAVVIFGSQHLSSTASIGKDHFLLPGFVILIPLFIILGLIWLMRTLLSRPYTYPKYPNYPPPAQ